MIDERISKEIIRGGQFAVTNHGDIFQAELLTDEAPFVGLGTTPEAAVEMLAEAVESRDFTLGEACALWRAGIAQGRDPDVLANELGDYERVVVI